jgi:hypothetical protein
MKKALAALGMFGALALSAGMMALSVGCAQQGVAESPTTAETSGKENLEALNWPPRKGQPYPDLELIDQEGQTFRLSSLKGKALLVEPIGMTCAGCQAYSGGHEKGGLGGCRPQKDLPSLEELLPRFANGMEYPNDDLVLVQVILYDLKNKHPNPEDAADWAKHFGMDKSRGQIVAVPVRDMRSPATYKGIPGFHLVDKKFILRADGSGRRPPDNPYTDLMPMIPKVMSE